MSSQQTEDLGPDLSIGVTVADLAAGRCFVGMSGGDTTFNDTPFFWSAHYDLAIRCAAYGKGWDRIQVMGNIENRDCAVRYFRGDKLLAIAAMGRDQAVLEGARNLAGS